MVLVVADRVKQTSITTGTGTYDLDVALITGFQGFVAGIGNGNTCQVEVKDGTDWETILATVTDATPDTVSRDDIIASSNGGAAVNWGAGIKTLFVTFPGDLSSIRDVIDLALITAVGNLKYTFTDSITAGTTQTQVGATALTTSINRVTVSGTDGDGVKLPTAVAGLEVEIINADSAQTIQVWPNTSDTIDGGSADAVDANALEAGSSRRYIARDATNWVTSTPAGRGWVLLASATASNSATIDFDTAGFIDSDYDQYMVRITDWLNATDGQKCQMRVSDDLGITYETTGYDWVVDLGSDNTGTPADDDQALNGNSFDLSGDEGQDTGGDATFNGEVHFANPAGSAKNKQFWWTCRGTTSGGNGRHFKGGGKYRQNTNALDGIRFISQSGNITSGEFALYGLTKG